MTKSHWTTRAGLILSPGLLLFCAAWMLPKWSHPDWDLFTWLKAHPLANIPAIILLPGGAIVSPILLVCGLFLDKRKRSWTASAQPFFVFMALYLLAASLPWFYILQRDHVNEWTTFTGGAFFLAFFGLAMLVHTIIRQEPEQTL